MQSLQQAVSTIEHQADQVAEKDESPLATPLLLDPALLAEVSGGLPVGTWKPAGLPVGTW